MPLACPLACACDWKPVGNTRLTEVLRLLDLSADYVDQTPGRSGITGQQHALRCAGLAQFSNHRDAVFVALTHDLARPLNDVHHGEVVAWMVKDRVSTEAFDVLRTHGAFQSAVVHGTPMPQGHMARQLAGYEVRSFQPNFDGPEWTIEQAHQLLREYLS